MITLLDYQTREGRLAPLTQIKDPLNDPSISHLEALIRFFKETIIKEEKKDDNSD